jgi:hypothetical protein
MGAMSAVAMASLPAGRQAPGTAGGHGRRVCEHAP